MKPTPRNFALTPAWPSEYPSHCMRCQHPFDIRVSLEIGPGAVGRFLKKISPWICVVMIALMFLTKLRFLGFGGNGGAMAFAAAIVTPSVFVNVLASILPKKTRLYCHKCNHASFHPLPKKQDNRFRSVSE